MGFGWSKTQLGGEVSYRQKPNNQCKHGNRTLNKDDDDDDVIPKLRKSLLSLVCETALCVVLFDVQIYLCRNTARFPEAGLPKAIVLKSGVSYLVSDGAVLESGESIAADAIILCTGYHYSFPFLSADCQFEVTAENRIASLYKSLVHTHFPTLFFIGVPKMVIPFPLFDRQAQFVVAQLSGKVVLPDVQEMEYEVRRAYDAYSATGKAPRHFHDMGPLQWAYMESLEAEIGVIPLPPVVRKIAEVTRSQRLVDIVSYKNCHYKIVDENSFVEL